MAPVINYHDDPNMGDESSWVFPLLNEKLLASHFFGNECQTAF